jgi:uncharacterized protein
MPQSTEIFDLAPLALVAGQGRRLELHVPLGGFDLGGERYEAAEPLTPVTLDVSKMTGGGHSLRLRLAAALEGPCMRCLEPARPDFEVDAREVSKPGGGDDLESPYLDGDELDLRAWARDALVLALPATLLCRPDCAGLCPECGADLNEAGPDHHHEKPPDSRWAKLNELKLD